MTAFDLNQSGTNQDDACFSGHPACRVSPGLLLELDAPWTATNAAVTDTD